VNANNATVLYIEIRVSYVHHCKT